VGFSDHVFVDNSIKINAVNQLLRQPASACHNSSGYLASGTHDQAETQKKRQTPVVHVVITPHIFGSFRRMPDMGAVEIHNDHDVC